MRTWFIWNNRNSDAEGLWISKLPNITRANERYEEVDVPGRSGSLVITEGEDVFESYVKECVVTLPNNRNIQNLLNWLRGSGKVTFSNEIDKEYDAHIASEVSFERIGNTLLQATVPFFVKPIKHLCQPKSITVTADTTIYNPGDVASKPTVSITASGNVSISIAGQTMTFNSVSGTIVVDCEAEIITANNQIWQGTFSGDFWKIPKGTSAVDIPASCTLVIDPKWGWV